MFHQEALFNASAAESLILIINSSTNPQLNVAYEAERVKTEELVVQILLQPNMV